MQPSSRFEDMDELVEHINSKHKNGPPSANVAEGGTGDDGEGGGGDKETEEKPPGAEGGDEKPQGENHVNGAANGVSRSALSRLSFYLSLSALHTTFSYLALLSRFDLRVLGMIVSLQYLPP